MKMRLLFLAILPLLGGCAGYKAHKLKTLSVKCVPRHENISFGAKKFNHTDCHTYLGRNVLLYGFTPIQLAIKNNSQSSFCFSLAKINLKTVDAYLVAESSFFSVWARALGYGIPALFVIGLPLAIPAVVDSMWAVEANETLLKDYLDKALSDTTLEPDAKLEGLIFVSNNNYKNNLEVTLSDNNSSEKIVCKELL